ncbi:MAG: nucleotide exchange factor GrpE [Candidatus Omnitrophica bacterium]|nr:nucleotide exchange factor GrpE [Candidatus Omnitrophota bacterium]MBU4334853.1 nucleotide exchange factor GrpE [Candidatus Omnitrophota bacterium]
MEKNITNDNIEDADQGKMEEDKIFEEKANMDSDVKAKHKKDIMIKVKESEYKRLENEIAEYKDKHLRLYAEFENVRKRMERDKMEFAKYANVGLIAEFLEILDNLERTIAAAKAKHQDYDAFEKGVEMVMKQIYEMLKKNGVKPIDAKGKAFDPHCHEALLQEETDEVDEGIVLEEFQKGYSLQDRIVRTAKVKLSKKKETKETEEVKEYVIDVESSPEEIAE